MSKSSRFRCNFSLHSSQVVTASKEEPGGEEQGKVSIKLQQSMTYDRIIQAWQTVIKSWLNFAERGYKKASNTNRATTC